MVVVFPTLMILWSFGHSVSSFSKVYNFAGQTGCWQLWATLLFKGTSNLPFQLLSWQPSLIPWYFLKWLCDSWATASSWVQFLKHWLWHITSSIACRVSAGFSVPLDLSRSELREGKTTVVVCTAHCQRIGAAGHQWSCSPCLYDVSVVQCVLWILAAQKFQREKEGWQLLLQLFINWYMSVVNLCVISETAATDGKSPKCKLCWHAQHLTSDSLEKILRNLGTVAYDGLFLIWPVSSTQLISVSLCFSR